MNANSNHLTRLITQQLEEFLHEMGAEHAIKRITMTADLEADLGIDSLGRIEFFHRVEEALRCKLPTAAFVQAQTLKELEKFVAACVPHEELAKRRLPTPPPTDKDLKHLEGETLIDSLTKHVESQPDRVHIYFQDEDGSEKPITYKNLYDASRKTAAGLVELGLKPNETVAIMLPTSPDFFSAFFGILFAGGIPVPIYPPFRPSRLEEYVHREAKLLRNAGAKFLITFPQAQALSHVIKGFIPTMKAVVTVPDLQKSTHDLPELVIVPSDPAFIQYTSGSTGNPKGVLLSHSNILTNLKAAAGVINVTPQDHIVSWLPLYHDMGLIGFWFGSMHFGVPVTIMSPLTFLSRPEKWLWAIHAHRGTISAAPNFAYELCINKVKDDAIKGLDLSSWRLALNGAEAVHASTLRRFAEKYEPYGFSPSALYPVYGMAESTVALAFPPMGRRKPLTDIIQRESLEKKGVAIKAEAHGPHTTEIVACGQPLPGHQIKIVDDQGDELPERTVGHLWFKGPSTMQGYYNNPEATQAITHNGWTDSGDYAYIAEGEVFITGRTKDMIIKAGRNIYPEDIEDIAGSIEGIRKGRVIAFSVEDKEHKTEKFVIVAETLVQDPNKRDDITHQITSKIVAELGIPPDTIVLSRPGTIPKTSSGKLQRFACKHAFIKGDLEHKPLPQWYQIAKMTTRSGLATLKTLFFKAGKVVFSLYVSFIIALLIIPALLTIAVLPQTIAQKLTKFWVRLFFMLCFWRLKFSNKELLQQTEPTIYVANHASHIDALLLIAVLPPDVSFVGKRELITFPPLRWIMRKLGHLTVERTDVSQSLIDLERMQSLLQAGRSLMIFPEGTFTHIIGLRPFKLGAFKLAAETNTQICPISIHGARTILPADAFLVRPATIEISVCPPIKPEGKEWPHILKLKDQARANISEGCGEPVYESD